MVTPDAKLVSIWVWSANLTRMRVYALSDGITEEKTEMHIRILGPLAGQRVGCLLIAQPFRQQRRFDEPLPLFPSGPISHRQLVNGGLEVRVGQLACLARSDVFHLEHSRRAHGAKGLSKQRRQCWACTP
jgi:hypothetical protein